VDKDNIPDALITVMKIFIIKEILIIIDKKIQDSIGVAEDNDKEPYPITENSTQLIESSVEKIKSDDDHPFKNPNFPKFLQKTDKEYQQLIESLKQNNDEYKSIFDIINNNRFDITITGLESAGNEGAGEGAALPSSARTVVNAISVSPDKSPAVNAEPVLPMGGGPNLSRPNFNQDSINTVVEGITQSHQGFLSDIITNINSIDSVDVHASNAAKIEKLNSLLTNAQARLQSQISNLQDVNNEFKDKTWSGEYFSDEQVAELAQRLKEKANYNSVTLKMKNANFPNELIKRWNEISQTHKEQYDSLCENIFRIIREVNVSAKSMEQVAYLQQVNHLRELTDLNEDDKTIFSAIEQISYENERGIITFTDINLSEYNNILEENKISYNDYFGLFISITNTLDFPGIGTYDNIQISGNDVFGTKKKEKIRDIYIQKMQLFLAYIMYLKTCKSLDVKISSTLNDDYAKTVFINPNLDTNKIELLTTLGEAKYESVIDIYLNTLGKVYIEPSKKKEYNKYLKNINDMNKYLIEKKTTITDFINSYNRVKGAININFLNIFLQTINVGENYETKVDEIIAQYQASLKEMEEQEKQFKIGREKFKKKKILASEETKGLNQEDDYKLISDNIVNLWSGKNGGFEKIYNDATKITQNKLTSEMWKINKFDNITSFFDTKYFSIFLYKTINFIRNNKDKEFKFNLIEKYNFYLLLYRVFTDTEININTFKGNNIITQTQFGFFASKAGKDIFMQRVRKIENEKNLKNIPDFLEFQIKTMICYLLHKHPELDDIKTEKINMFLFATFSLLKNKECIHGYDSDKKESLSTFYEDRIFKRIQKGEENIQEILDNCHKIIVGDKEVNIEFDYEIIINNLVDLIKKNLILLNPLRALYKYVFSKINVIMRISDVQCAKKQPYKPRKINKMLISHSGDSLIFSNIEKQKINDIEGNNNIESNIGSNLKTFQFDFMNHIYGPNDTNKMMTDRINYGFFNLLKSYDSSKLLSQWEKKSIIICLFYLRILWFWKNL